jgi:hypothetical protein
MKAGRVVWLAALVALIVAASPAAAETPGPHSGNVGVHALIDTNQFPGVTCVFHTTPDDLLHRIKVRAPIVYAYDRTTGTDTEWVGWRFRIQTSTNGTDWTDAPGGVSSFVKVQATDQYNAQWSTRVYVVPQPPAGSYRAVVNIRWYYPTASHVDGRSVRYPTYYLDAGQGVSRFVGTRCATSLG